MSDKRKRKSLTGDPDVVQLRGLLHHLGGERSQSELQLLPVQWVPHPHLLRSKKDSSDPPDFL